MKAAVKRILVLALIASLLLFPGCTEEPEEKAPSNYDLLFSQMGRSTAEVCQALDLDKAQVDNALAGEGTVPSLGEATYAGLTWLTYPIFDSKTDMLCGFYYEILYPEDPDQAAPIFADLLVALEEDCGSPFQEANPFRNDQKITAEAVLNHIWQKGHLHFFRKWDLRQQIKPEMSSTIDQIKQAYPRSKAAVSTYGAIFSYRADLDTASLTLTYEFFPWLELWS